jgi:hypothetical protein
VVGWILDITRDLASKLWGRPSTSLESAHFCAFSYTVFHLMLQLLGFVKFSLYAFVHFPCYLALRECPQEMRECARICARFSGNPAENLAHFWPARTRTRCSHAGICDNFRLENPGIRQARYPAEVLNPHPDCSPLYMGYKLWPMSQLRQRKHGAVQGGNPIACRLVGYPK